MGGKSSTPRRITVEEDGASGVMRISESVARRLVGQEDIPSSSQMQRKEIQRTSSQGLMEHEDMEKMEDHYQQQISVLEARNAQLYEDSKEQFAKTVQKVEQKFLKTTASPICEDLQTEVLKCYQNNSRQTLNCASLVRAFEECVQKQREKILTRKG